MSVVGTITPSAMAAPRGIDGNPRVRAPIQRKKVSDQARRGQRRFPPDHSRGGARESSLGQRPPDQAAEAKPGQEGQLRTVVTASH